MQGKRQAITGGCLCGAVRYEAWAAISGDTVTAGAAGRP